mmetsp:Transcript_48491/g.80522  ORF Transcript_48491/g.80522 Transcript_48491/m.80522 type:complete len:176 (-) Transcript_48491:250-777(-)
MNKAFAMTITNAVMTTAASPMSNTSRRGTIDEADDVNGGNNEAGDDATASIEDGSGDKPTPCKDADDVVVIGTSGGGTCGACPSAGCGAAPEDIFDEIVADDDANIRCSECGCCDRRACFSDCESHSSGKGKAAEEAARIGGGGSTLSMAGPRAGDGLRLQEGAAYADSGRGAIG